MPRLGGKRETRAFLDVMLLLEQGKQDEAYKKGREFHGQVYPYNSPKPVGRPKASLMWEQVLEWTNLLKRTDRWASGFHDII